MVVVDAMHNLFLGLTQFHIREVLGIEEYKVKSHGEKPKPIAEKEIAKARVVLAACSEKLNRFSLPVVQKLYAENKISIHNVNGKQSKKKYLIQELLIRFILLVFILAE